MKSLSLNALKLLPLLILFVLCATIFSNTTFNPAGASLFADFAFGKIWTTTDLPVASGIVRASWVWGPAPRYSIYEPYRDAPGNKRLVQYFDKSRMEITNPNANPNDNWFVTNGLLCREMVLGQVQMGDSEFEKRRPTNLPVAGDLDSPTGPTYATFNPLASLNNDRRSSPMTGYVVQSLSRDGRIGTTETYSQKVSYAFYENKLGHNIPDIFEDWMNDLAKRGVSWQYALGLPLTEPFWTNFKVAGVEREILVQLFERRTLTYDPLNSPEWQVEMGNIGLHYYSWRYNSIPSGSIGDGKSSLYGLDPEEIAYFSLINQYRQANGKPTLALNSILTNTAHWMSQDMANKNYFSHTDSLGRDPFTRLAAFGYTSNVWKGENLAAGYKAASGVLAGWQASPAHNENMLQENFHTLGISRTYNANSTYKWYWATEFGGQ